MNAEKAYSIKLAGEINIDEGKTFYVEKYIRDGEYHSNIYMMGEKKIKVTNGGAERSPKYRKGVLYYIKYSKDNEKLIKLEALSEPEEICTFYKIKKYIVTEIGIFVIGLEKADTTKPFSTTRIKYRFNGSGLLRKRYNLYRINHNTRYKIYDGDFDVIDVKYNGGRLVIQSTEENDDYGLSDLYEISQYGKKIKKVTKKSYVINGYSISEKGGIAISMHDNLDPWEINNIVYPEEEKKVLIGNDSNDSILTDLFFTIPYKIKYCGNILYAVGQTKSTSNIYRIEGNTMKQVTEIKGKLIDFDVENSSYREKLAYVYSTPDHPSILVADDNSHDINNATKGIIPVVQQMDGGEYFFVLQNPHAPTLVFIHGGPQTAYGYTYYIEFQFFYENGYNILYANPPGSTGYGGIYEKDCAGDWGNKDFHYIQKAMANVMEKFGVVDNFAVTGGSYGGFMTNWIVTHSNAFKCGISERSISNLLSMIGTSDIGFWFNTLQLKIDDPYSKEGIRKLMEYSPIVYVKDVKTPVLLITGEEDYRCPIEQAEQFYMGLKLNNTDTELIRYQSDNHEHARSGIPANMVDRLNRKLAWFNKYMKE
jgi:dipeptidyl aminopeptidase/acylaminoacyl peptidase